MGRTGIIRPGRVLIAAALLAIAALASPTQAQAQQRTGANLNRPAQNTYDCTVVPPFNYGSGVGSCTHMGVSVTGEAVQTPYPGGVFTAVRVKTGNTTGPMRITVTRAFRSFQGPACCFYAGQSQVFTPAANKISTVRVRLPGRNDLDPNFGETVDYLAITVLQPGYAIPGFLASQDSQGIYEQGSLGFYPQITPADEASGRVDGAGTNLLPLINADVFPLCGGTAAAKTEKQRRQARRAVEAAGRCLGGVSIRRGSIAGRRALIPLLCNLTSACRGKLVLKRAGGRGAAAAGGKLGKSRFKLRSAGRKRIKVKLTKAGRRAVRGKRKLKVKVKAKVKGGPNETKKVKLKR